MLNKISFKNYKAFSEGEIKIKPITILLGANSVGKSSIVNLLLMLQQTVNAKNYQSALRLHGENISMGEPENIFRNKDTQKKLYLEFEFTDDQLKSTLKDELIMDLLNRVTRPIQYYEHFYDNIELNNIINNKVYFYKNGEYKKAIFKSADLFSKLLTDIENLQKNLEGNNRKVKSPFHLVNNVNKNIFSIDNTNETIKSIYEFLLETKKISNNIFNLSFEIEEVICSKEKVLKVSSITLRNQDKIVLSISFTFNNRYTAYNDISIKSEFVDELKYDKKLIQELQETVNYNSTIFSILPNVNKERDLFFSIYEDNYSIGYQTIIQIMSSAIDTVKDNLTKQLINHVSPLRAYPQRYYFLDKANINTYLNTLDGNALTEVLKENKVVKSKVNDWLKKFNLSVNVDTLQDVIHKLKIIQNDLNLDITDVGFGISQILPVIVQGFLAFDNSLSIIEQPEIHLHPTMQANLADLFIDVVKSKQKVKKYLLIETHSEYFLRRLRRRIEDPENPINSDDVAIYYIHPKTEDNTSATIEEKNVLENGFFEWPKDFMDKDLEKDMISFIHQQLTK